MLRQNPTDVLGALRDTLRDLGGDHCCYYKNGAESHFLTFMSGAKGNQGRDGGASDLPFENGRFMKVDGGAASRMLILNATGAED